MLSANLWLNAFLGALIAFTVLRADWRRRENQLIALACLLDDLTLIGVGVLVTLGAEIASQPVVHFAQVSRVLIVHPLLEFAYAFPSGRRPPTWMRWLGLSATLAALGLGLSTLTAAWFDRWSVLVFFIPYFVVTLTALVRSLIRVGPTRDARGIRIIILAMLVRWIAEVTTMLLVRPLLPDAFPTAFAFDMTVVAFAHKVSSAYAVLKHHFFRVRGLIAEAILVHLLGLSALGLLVFAVELILTQISDPWLQRCALVAVSLCPFLAWLLVRRSVAQLTAALLFPLDPHRVLHKTVLERALRQTVNEVEPTAICALTCRALEELGGGRATFLRCPETGAQAINLTDTTEPELSAALMKHLESSEVTFIRPADHERLTVEAAAWFATQDIDLVTPVRFGGKLLGALIFRGGEIDQDTISTAVALASNLGSKLAHAALYQHAFRLQRQIDDTSHLATLGSFAAAIAHDIRTPLTSVQMNLQMIRRQAGLSVDHIESADIALEELERMAAYVSEILDYSKPLRLQPVEIDVGQLMEETARSLEPLLGARRLQLDVQVGSTGSVPVLRADATHVRQILLNLLENAADASAPGGTIRLQAHALGADRVSIEVTDHGRGIASKDLSRIFEPFFTTRSEGTGLGLAIVKKLVLGHAGEINVRSALDAGSTFTVVLPT
jgi:signal transduction histidine kinase